MIPLPSCLISRAVSSLEISPLNSLNLLSKKESSEFITSIIPFSRSLISVIKPSVVTETTFPLSFCTACKHSPTKLLIKPVTQDAKIGLDKK